MDSRIRRSYYGRDCREKQRFFDEKRTPFDLGRGDPQTRFLPFLLSNPCTSAGNRQHPPKIPESSRTLVAKRRSLFPRPPNPDPSPLLSAESSSACSYGPATEDRILECPLPRPSYRGPTPDLRPLIPFFLTILALGGITTYWTSHAWQRTSIRSESLSFFPFPFCLMLLCSYALMLLCPLVPPPGSILRLNLRVLRTKNSKIQKNFYSFPHNDLRQSAIQNQPHFSAQKRKSV